MNYHLQSFIEPPNHAFFWIAAFLASAAGFLFHVLAAEKIRAWTARQMTGKTVSTSRSVIVPAAITSLEMGIGLVICYALIRDHLPFASLALRGLTLGLLALANQGKLFRQPLMNLLVGNPVKVVLVQDGLVWINWLLMSTVLAVAYEGLQ
jgi:hypothetical protein